jgi:hypothetical protein
MRSSGRRLGSVHGAKSRFEPAISLHSDASRDSSPNYLTQIEPTANAAAAMRAVRGPNSKTPTEINQIGPGNQPAALGHQ